MILIAARSITQRLEYIAEIIFDRLLHVDYKIVTPENLSQAQTSHPDAVMINYSSSQNFSERQLSVPDENLLFETDIRQTTPTLANENFLKVKFSGQDYSGFSIDFDIFSSAFYLLTEYEKYANPKYDMHGRYDEMQYELYREKYHQLPVLHIYADYLWQKISVLNPKLKREENEFKYTITFDIDAPYLYRGRNSALQFAGFAKEVLTLNFSALKMRMKFISSGKDPYDVYDYILSGKSPMQFFFLMDRHAAEDGRHTFETPIYRELIKRISSANIPIGIHPSYTSYKDEDKIAFEKQQLGLITGKAITSSRMHFLKYSLPDTYRNLIDCGITDDFTSCPVHSPGFKNFIGIPYPWFNVVNNIRTELIIHPSMLMDVSLRKYMHLTPDAALEEIKKIISVTRSYRGCFGIILHNSTLSNFAEWKGWRDVYEGMLEYLIH